MTWLGNPDSTPLQVNHELTPLMAAKTAAIRMSHVKLNCFPESSHVTAPIANVAPPAIAAETIAAFFADPQALQ
jgi:hypothetical protein